MMQLKIGFLPLAILFTQAQGVTETVELLTGNGCGRTSQVSGGVVVSHQPWDTLPPISNDYTCFFQMRSVRFNQKVRFMFSHFSLSPNDCSLANLTFFDGPMETDPEITVVCPDDTDVLTREFSGNSFWLTFRLRVSSVSTEERIANFSGFYVSYTDDRDPCVNTSAELMCNNGNCIFDELECDGLDSCGDNTDESTMAPTFCDSTTTTGQTTATAQTTTIGVAATTEPGLFSDLTPLYITLTIAFAMLLAYVVYILLSFAWFKAWMVSCLHHCFLVGIRRRRKWREADEENKGGLQRKITPEKDDSLTLEDLTAPEPPATATTPVPVPPVFASTAPASPKALPSNGISTQGKKNTGPSKKPKVAPKSNGVAPKSDKKIMPRKGTNSATKITLEF